MINMSFSLVQLGVYPNRHSFQRCHQLHCLYYVTVFQLFRLVNMIKGPSADLNIHSVASAIFWWQNTIP